MIFNKFTKMNIQNYKEAKNSESYIYSIIRGVNF